MFLEGEPDKGTRQGNQIWEPDKGTRQGKQTRETDKGNRQGKQTREPEKGNRQGKQTREPDMGTRHAIFVDGNDMIKFLHVVDADFSTQDYSVFLKLIPEIAKSVRPWPKELLEHHRLFYDTEQLDVMVDYTLFVCVAVPRSRTRPYRLPMAAVHVCGRTFSGVH